MIHMCLCDLRTEFYYPSSSEAQIKIRKLNSLLPGNADVRPHSKLSTSQNNRNQDFYQSYPTKLAYWILLFFSHSLVSLCIHMSNIHHCENVAPYIRYIPQSDWLHFRNSATSVEETSFGKAEFLLISVPWLCSFTLTLSALKKLSLSLLHSHISKIGSSSPA